MLLLLGESNWDCIVKNGQKGVEILKKDLDLKGFGMVILGLCSGSEWWGGCSFCVCENVYVKVKLVWGRNKLRVFKGLLPVAYDTFACDG